MSKPAPLSRTKYAVVPSGDSRRPLSPTALAYYGLADQFLTRITQQSFGLDIHERDVASLEDECHGGGRPLHDPSVIVLKPFLLADVADNCGRADDGPAPRQDIIIGETGSNIFSH